MDFLHQLYKLKALLLSEVFPQFQYIAASIGAITATILIVTVVLNAYIRTEGIDWGLALRPFCIAFVLSVFPALIIQPLDGISQAINKWMSGICKENIERTEALKERIKEKIENQNTFNIDEYQLADADPEYVDKIFEEHEKNAVGEPSTNWIQRTMMSIFTWIIEILTDIAQIFISFLSMIYLMILSLTGPITFALAIIPSFRGGITSWFARYIQIMLWMPLAQIYMYLMYSVQNIILENSLHNNEIVTHPTLTMLCIGTVSVIGLFKIPTIAEWIVESTGGAAFNSAVNKAGYAAGQKGGQVAAAAPRVTMTAAKWIKGKFSK